MRITIYLLLCTQLATFAAYAASISSANQGYNYEKSDIEFEEVQPSGIENNFEHQEASVGDEETKSSNYNKEGNVASSINQDYSQEKSDIEFVEHAGQINNSLEQQNLEVNIYEKTNYKQVQPSGIENNFEHQEVNVADEETKSSNYNNEENIGSSTNQDYGHEKSDIEFVEHASQINNNFEQKNIEVNIDQKSNFEQVQPSEFENNFEHENLEPSIGGEQANISKCNNKKIAASSSNQGYIYENPDLNQTGSQQRPKNRRLFPYSEVVIDSYDQL